MIQLTRLNKKPLFVNSDMIKFIENTPDTVITLVTNEKVVVLESPREVLDQIIYFRRLIGGPGSTFPPSGESGAEESSSRNEEGE